MSPTTVVFQVETINTLREQLGDAGGELLAELIQLYLTQARDLVAQIAAAVAADDAPLLGSLAHKLRGSTATLGGDRLADVCQRLEEAPAVPDEGERAEIANTAVELRQGYDELEVELVAYQESLRTSRAGRLS